MPKYNLLDLKENIILSNSTIEEIEEFLNDKDSNLYIIEEL